MLHLYNVHLISSHMEQQPSPDQLVVDLRTAEVLEVALQFVSAE